MTLADRQKLRAARWQKLEQEGMWRFVWKHGVLRWGLLTGLLASVITLSSSEAPPLPWYVFVPITLVACMVGGFFWGAGMWFVLKGTARLARMKEEKSRASAYRDDKS